MPPPEGAPQIWDLELDSCVVIWPVGGLAKDGQYRASYQDPPELGLFVHDPWRVPPPPLPRSLRGSSQHTAPLCPASLCPQPWLDLEISHTRNWGGGWWPLVVPANKEPLGLMLGLLLNLTEG